MPSKTLNGKQIFYTQSGPSHGPASHTILLIHGLGSSSSFYASITPHLSKSYQCIAMDTYGSGLSKLFQSHPENSIQAIAKDAIALLDALSVTQKVVVVGHSMGGIVASELSATYPERVEGVVLLGPVHPGPKITEVFEARIGVVEKNGVEALADTVPTAATGKASLPIHHAFIRALILGTEPAGYISLCKCIATARAPDYASIKAPLLIVAGENDQSAPRGGCETILEKYGTTKQNKRIVDLEGVGHWHCVEAGDRVAELVDTFVKELDA